MMCRSRNRDAAYVIVCRHHLRFLLHTSRSLYNKGLRIVETHSHQKYQVAIKIIEIAVYGLVHVISASSTSSRPEVPFDSAKIGEVRLHYPIPPCPG
jgi:hypothetical protein